MGRKRINDLLEKLDTIQPAEAVQDQVNKKVPSFVRFCSDYLFIRKRGAAEDEALIRFDRAIWRKGQRRLAAYLVRHRKQHKPIRLIVHKVRQRASITTMATAFLLYLVWYGTERKAMLAAHLKEPTLDIFKMAHRFVMNMPIPDEEKPTVFKNELEFPAPNNSTFICVTAGSGEVARSGAVHYFHGSEVAFYEQPEVFFQGLNASIPETDITSDSCIIKEGTAKGRGYFYDECLQAQKGESEYDFMFFSWTDEADCQIPMEPGEVLSLKESEAEFQHRYALTDPQMKWALHMVKNQCFGKWEVFHQEYPTVSELAFDYTGYPLIDREKAKEDIANAPDPIFQGNIEWRSIDTYDTALIADEYGPLVIWEHPVPDGDYYIPIDIGEGLRADFTELPVLRHDEGEIRQVALFRSNRVKPDATGIIGFQLGAYYNFALLIPEQNGPGLNTCQVLRDGHNDDPQTAGGYPNLYYRERYEKATKEITRVMGFLTTRHNKEALLSKLGELYDKGVVVIKSKVALDQLAGSAKDPETRRMVQNHKDPETGFYHDDAVMSLGIGVFVISGEDKILNSGGRRFIHKPKKAGW
jgi:hypothetical protein